MPVLTARPRHRLVLPLTVIGVLGLAACGTTAGTTTATPSSAGSTADAGPPAADGTDMEAFRTCMEQNGVTLPERGGDRPPAAGAQPGDGAAAGDRPAPPGVDADTWAAAQQACATLAPTPPA